MIAPAHRKRLSLCLFTACALLMSGAVASAQSASPRTGPADIAPPDALTDDSLDALEDVEAPPSLSDTEAPPSSTEAPTTSTPAQTEVTPSPPETPTAARPADVEPDEAAAPAARSAAPPVRRRQKVPSRVAQPAPSRQTQPAPPTRIGPRDRRFIHHPNAERGLIKIDKDRNYLYRVKASEQKSAASMRLGMYEPSDLQNPEDAALTFEELYDENNFPVVLYDQERQFYQGFGKLAWKFGGGFYFAQGNGRFAEGTGPNANLTPKEKFTLLVFPFNLGAVYRFHYFRNQWVIPYVEGALDAFAFAEIRDDDKNPSLGAALGLAPAAHFSAGASIPLGRGSRSFLDLDSEYGINAIYLTFEYRQYVALSNKYDFGGDAITGGITAEY